MNEVGVFGRFVPDFGRIVAQMQYDMYHVYTVDEHTLSALGIMHRIEDGKLTRPPALLLGHPQGAVAARCMSRCCCTTSPRAGRKITRSPEPGSPASSARGSGSMRPKRTLSPGWWNTTC
jgi:hypothetical protein